MEVYASSVHPIRSLKRFRTVTEEIADPNAHDPDELFPQEDEFWTNASLFTLDAAVAEPWEDAPDNGAAEAFAPSYSDLDAAGSTSQNASEEWLRTYFPELLTTIPTRKNGWLGVGLTNPFVEGSKARYSDRRMLFALPDGGAVNGYIKFRISNSDLEEEDTQPRYHLFGKPSQAKHHRDPWTAIQQRHALRAQMHGDAINGQNGSVVYLPPGFGSASRLDATDHKILKFYTAAICSGRTLIPDHNMFLIDITAIADQDDCVKHSVLAFTAVYVMDYLPQNEKLRTRANQHYSKAVNLLSAALADPRTQQIGHEEGLLAAILMILCDDIINWEVRKAKDQNPKWLQGTRLLKTILDNTDRGFRYWHPENVQSSVARRALANRIAFVDILALLVLPLQQMDPKRLYSWLLEGPEQEVRRIHGVTGLSPKLLHVFAQITYLTGRLAKTPTFDIIPKAAPKIEQRLQHLLQWSSLSPGYATAEQLFAACRVDAAGQVSTASEVTDLTAESWRTAALLYLYCRFYRLPRSHPLVLSTLETLIGCITRMPATGPLFTAQAPFFPVFLVGVLAYYAEHRRVAREWFDTVVSGAGCRSSVPPIWRMLQDLWLWVDENVTDVTDDPEGQRAEEMPIGEREPWWERVVERLTVAEGVWSLC